MCNLSQGIKEDGIAIGIASAIIAMHENGYTAERIATALNKDIEEVEQVLEKNAVLV